MSTARRRSDAAHNRERVLAAARASVRAGDASLPLNEIAHRVGVGVGTVYRHFPTRQALLEAVLDEPLTLLLDRARAAEADPDPRGAFVRLVRAAADLESGHAGFAEVLSTEDAAGEATAEKRAELAAIGARVLERARAADVVRPDVTVDDLQRLVCGIGYAARLSGADPRERSDRYTEVLLAGLRP